MLLHCFPVIFMLLKQFGILTNAEYMTFNKYNFLYLLNINSKYNILISAGADIQIRIKFFAS